jgi:hypothetical protein
MKLNWKRILLLMIPAALIGFFLAYSSNGYIRAISSVPVILAWIIYYTWIYLEKRKLD